MKKNAECEGACASKPTRLFFLQLQGKVRRFYLTTFRRGYVREQMRRRSGKCLQCGACCRLAGRCAFLTREKRCRIYHLVRPNNCTSFPIDERDLRETRAKCGYSFEKPPDKP